MSVSGPILAVMATVYYTASSLDGFIVDDHDSLDWLLTRDIDAAGPFGYEAFAASVGALVMGSQTYEWLVRNQEGDWMYEQPSWVLTSRPGIVADGHPVRSSTAMSPSCIRSCRPRREIATYGSSAVGWWPRSSSRPGWWTR